MLRQAQTTFVSGVLSMSDGSQCVCRPRVIPVDCAAVDNTWELSASVSELVSYGRECQDNV
jgi:hypothetical protein